VGPTRSLDEVRRTPAYLFPEAAHYLNLPLSTLRAWCLGQDYSEDRKTPRFVALIKLDGDRHRDGLSFLNLVEAHVLSAIRRTHRIALPKVRQALQYVSSELHAERPLLNVRFQTNGVGLFVDMLGGLVNVTQAGQLALREGFAENLARIRRDAADIPIKLFPFTRTPGMTDSECVEMDPTIAFGRPVIRGRATPTAVLADRFKAGDSFDELAEDLDLPRNAIEDAIRCELRLRALAA
jgi:uncharacterized protein (DUF433 family)